MFKAALEYIHILSERMKEFNRNIDWEVLLLKAKDKTDEQMLYDVIRPKVWVNKSHGEDLDDKLNLHYFIHFTKIFKRYEKLDHIYIVEGEPFEGCPEELIMLLEKKKDVLERFMKVRMIRREEKQTRNSYVVPLYSLVYNEEIKGKIIKDNELYSFVITNPIINKCLIACKLLVLGVPVEDIVSNVEKFYFI